MTSLHWRAHPALPENWATYVTRFDGGFFHSPHGLWGSASHGDPIFLTLHRGEEVVGIALGSRRSCRFSNRARHYYFPSPPAVAPSVGRDRALDALVAFAAREGGADLRMDAFDVDAAPEPVSGALPAPRRQEYLVELSPTPDQLLQACCGSHRRHIRKGERSGWELRRLYGDEAMAALYEVQGHASQRATTIRNSGFSVAAREEVARETASELGSPWGAGVFAAYAEGELLGAVLIGWAGRRAYNSRGGSTPRGYDLGAAPWTHWRVMCLLREHGIELYNLGGTPADSVTPGHPSHGLHVFKEGFNASLVPCSGLSWELSRGHGRVHEAAEWLVRRIRSRAA